MSRLDTALIVLAVVDVNAVPGWPAGVPVLVDDLTITPIH